MERIKLCCAKCGFTIEEYTATELAEIPRKAKRHNYLLNKSSICPSCLASGRLKEVRSVEDTPVAPTAQPPAHSSVAPSKTLPWRRRHNLQPILRSRPWHSPNMPNRPPR